MRRFLPIAIGLAAISAIYAFLRNLTQLETDIDATIDAILDSDDINPQPYPQRTRVIILPKSANVHFSQGEFLPPEFLTRTVPLWEPYDPDKVPF